MTVAEVRTRGGLPFAGRTTTGDHCRCRPPASAEDATLTLVLPGDRAVWPIGRPPGTVDLTGYGNVARVGALQVLYDLSHASGPDAGDAAYAWLDWMLLTDPVV